MMRSSGLLVQLFVRQSSEDFVVFMVQFCHFKFGW